MAAHTEAGILLAEARNEAKQTQKQVADRLGLHQSRVSRLEAGDGDPSLEDYFTYLDALGTERALHLKKVFGFDWRHLPSPSLKHPSRRPGGPSLPSATRIWRIPPQPRPQDSLCRRDRRRKDDRRLPAGRLSG
jgi:transcriptional regulator with XRE-family HTH domain